MDSVKRCVDKPHSVYPQPLVLIPSTRYSMQRVRLIIRVCSFMCVLLTRTQYQAKPIGYECSDLLEGDQMETGKYSLEDLEDLPKLQRRSLSRWAGTKVLRPQGHRREIVWNSQQKRTVSLPAISCEFQQYLNNLKFSSHSPLNLRHGRYNKLMAHRCPGYSRVEITLTTVTTQTIFISHSTPTAYEICPVCQEVVIDDEILNCTCGEDGMLYLQ